MIVKLHITNYLLIDKLELKLREGLNIITGETGAGKSILLGAISLLLGGKNDKSISRNATANSIIEGVFDIEKYNLEELFAELDLEYETTTVIRRVIMPSGKSRSYINDLPVSLSTLQSVGDKLMDIHSQHQTLLLSHENFQINTLDSVAGAESTLASYQKEFAELKRLRLRVAKLKEDHSKAIENHDFIKFQYDELFDAALKDGEELQLESDLSILSNSSQIKELLFETSNTLSQSEEAVTAKIKHLANSFGKIGDILPIASSIEERLTSILYELKDIDHEVATNLDRVDSDPDKLAQYEQRLDMLHSLMIKHRVKNVSQLIAIREDLETQIRDVDMSTFYIESCQQKIKESQEKAEILAKKISEKRNKVAPKIEKYVEKLLKELGIENCQFKVAIEKSTELNINGEDKVSFLFSANKGIEPQPIDKVASGGEMSRVMLSLKSLIASHKAMPTIIFDEIDTGVSGRVADKIGEIMEHLGQTMQIICITHLPQVASKGDSHFLVSKEERDEATVSLITPLSYPERVNHIATMLSGSNITEAAISQAKSLLSSVK